MRRLFEPLWRDLRFTGRMFAARPGWTLAAIVCLAIATGANTAAFTVVNGLLLRPLPFDRPDELVVVALREPTQTGARPFALREYRELAERSGPAIALLARTYFPLSLAAEDGARMVQTEVVSGNYFDTLRVKPFLGTLFDASADRPGTAPSAVISHRLWRLRFKSDPHVIGRTVRVNSRPVTIAGITPPTFVGSMQLVASDLWLPASMYADLASSSGAVDSGRSASGGSSGSSRTGGSGGSGARGGGSGSGGSGSGSDGKAGVQRDVDMTPMFGAMGRLSPEMTASDAEARLAPIAADLARARGVTAPPAVVVRPATGFGAPPALEGTVMTLSGIVYAMMALLMAIACANVAALVLARGVGRTREIAVRLSLGASKLHIARQLLIESSVLAVAGCIAGSLVAFWLTQALVARLSTPFEYVSYAIDVQPDARVFAYAALITAFAAILCGIAPIRHAARVDVLDVLKQSAARGRSRESRRTLNAMVALQFAVSTALLAGAGMLFRAYLTSAAAQPGFDTRGLIVASIDVDQTGIDPARHAALYETVLERLSALPGVTSASLTRDLPRGSGSGSSARTATVFADTASLPDATSSSTPRRGSGGSGSRGGTGERVPASSNVVSSRYFQTLGLTLRQGRTFEDNEPARPLTAVIDETMARRLWPNASPLGRTFRLDRADSEPIHVIGVVSSTHDTTSSEPPTPVFYQPFPHHHAASMNVVLRTRAEPGAMFVDIRRAIQGINRDLAIVDLRTIDQMNAQNARQRRMPAVLLAAISLLGLLLSAVGLYGVIAYVVRERARELGIRLALGARPADVRGLVLRQGFRIVFIGLAIGMAATLALSRIMRSLMSGIGVIDPLTAGVVCAVLLTAGFAALYVPARWASTLDPAHTLRGE